jgi:hypothetical protein
MAPQRALLTRLDCLLSLGDAAQTRRLHDSPVQLSRRDGMVDAVATFDGLKVPKDLISNLRP